MSPVLEKILQSKNNRFGLVDNSLEPHQVAILSFLLVAGLFAKELDTPNRFLKYK
jgi:hypothetical protein